MKKTFFVTGTCTDVGKTAAACGLLRAAGDRGLQTLGLKPIAAGCKKGPKGLRNDDALRLQAVSTVTLSYEQVNPIALEPAVAPHIAASLSGRGLSTARVEGFCRGAMMAQYEFGVVEGAGGWRVPLNERENYSSVVQALNIPVILVVGLRLGCLNHALMTAETILRDGLKLAAWLASSLDENMVNIDENMSMLKTRLPAPYLGRVPFLQDLSAENVAQHLDVGALL